MPRSDVRPAGGFTLLEVIVALAITGFVLGGLFSLVGGSKQLTWRSQESLTRRYAGHYSLYSDAISRFACERCR